MVPTSSSPAESDRLSAAERHCLLAVARETLEQGLRAATTVPIDAQKYPAPLRALRASFVTLHVHDQLRGCIGTLEAQRPLVADVAYNAGAAAFHDPRFAPLSAAELEDLSIHIAVLQPAEQLQFNSEAELRAQLQPRLDGLILQVGEQRATFLPSVWESLPEPQEFLNQLKRKAGLPGSYWSDELRAWRYRTESFP